MVVLRERFQLIMVCDLQHGNCASLISCCNDDSRTDVVIVESLTIDFSSVQGVSGSS